MRNKKNSTVHDTDNYLQSLIVTNPLQEPVMRRVIHALDLPPGSPGLDIGCGICLQTIMLAEAVGTAGQVTGIDRSRSFWLTRETLQRRQKSLSSLLSGMGHEQPPVQ